MLHVEGNGVALAPVADASLCPVIVQGYHKNIEQTEEAAIATVASRSIQIAMEQHKIQLLSACESVAEATARHSIGRPATELAGVAEVRRHTHLPQAGGHAHVDDSPLCNVAIVLKRHGHSELEVVFEGLGKVRQRA